MIDVVSKSILIALTILATLAGGFLFWQIYIVPEPYIPPISKPVSFYNVPYAHASLGENIYAKSQNPIVNRVPEAAAPNVNPIEGVYKNPFD